VRLGRLAVETAVFPLFEVEHGKYHLTVQPHKIRPIRDYMKPQGRFRHLREPEVNYIQKRVIDRYRDLLAKCGVHEPEFPFLPEEILAEEGVK
jgi:pyruvate/2-oxoacid:ferredoxin oxidoreductase beta subunit